MTAPSDFPPSPNKALGLFHPVFQAWFREKVGVPTDVQARSWPIIASGRNVLLTAPTGSGKTLTAFLWALDAFASGRAEPGTTRILYISPLKALNNDIQRNLLGPLEELRGRFSAAALDFPDIRVLVRSGDTPSGERRRMLRHPPEILITTPESLNLLLLTSAGRDSLRGVGTVILDEIHAVAGTKRGTHLITAVDRLVPLAGEFQRIALSATVKPLKAVAHWVGGFTREGAEYLPRPMEIVESRAPKAYELHIRYPVEGGRPRVTPGDDSPGVKVPGATAPGTASSGAEAGIWESMAKEIKGLVGQARSTLIFANNRRLSERLARLLNEDEPKPIAYAHHGSLSREIRSVVEARMKEGRLPAIVATSSLELGIDIGALDQVVLVETPTSVAAALQRLGRAGHGVGQVSRGSLFASHPRDILDATVAVKCMEAGDIEHVRTIENPLDLLAQIIVSMAVPEDWDLDELYGFIRASHPYRTLPRRSFDLVIEMLAGRYADTRIRELRPRIAVDAVDRKVRALKGAPLLVGMSGGTIPDRGYYALRHSESRAKIGELDEEFVWERRVGELFTLGSRSWRIVNIGVNDVEVVPADRNALLAPFWRAEERDRDAHFSERLAEFLEEAEARLQDPAFAESLSGDRRLEPGAAAALLSFLHRQRAATGAPLPHRHHLLVEDCGEAPGKGGRQVVLHAVWGGRLTRPWGYALAAAWEEKGGPPLEIVQDDDCLLIRLPAGEPALALVDLVNADNLETMLRRKLEQTGFFAAHFRENAARALLLPRSTPRSRVPLWLNRLRSQKLLGAISGFGDFPIVLETWRECLRDEFALDALRARLEEVQSGIIRVREARTAKPSPFAEGLIWKQTNQFVYAPDKAGQGPGGQGPGGQGPGGQGPGGQGPGGQGPGGRGAARPDLVRPDLLREIAFSAPLRPRIPREIIRDFEAKAQRLAPGYPPQGSRELVEWAKERLLIPRPEWEALLPLAGLDAEIRDPAQGNPAGYLASRLIGISLPGAETTLLGAIESLPRILRCLGLGRADVALSGAEAPGSAPAPEALAALDRLLAGGGAPRDGGAGAGEDRRADVEAALPAEAAGETAAEIEVEDAREAAMDASMETTAEAAAEAPADRAADFLAQWLRAWGPVTPEFLRGIFGAAFPLIEEALAHLSESERVIVDLLAVDAAGAEICDAANVETLLRLMRRRSRPAVRALPAQRLPLFSAAWQGLAAPARDVEGVQGALERLFGYPAAAAAWEADILPARVMPYQTPWLDALFRDSDLLWFGAGRERIAFAFPEDLELFLAAGEAGPVLPDARRQILEILGRAAPARLDFQALAARVPLASDALTGALWDLAWSGRITNDTFAALRRGVETSFRFSLPDPAAGAGRRGGFQRWKAARPLTGSWLALDAGGENDPLEREDLAKDRARQLLRRYGVVFRELLSHELPALQWSRVFRALRLMELSGEVLSGHFFEGVPGLQFLSPSALPLVEEALPEDAVYWMSATDPASPCGLGLTGLPYALPPRASGIHMIFHGTELVLVSRRLGRDLTLRVPPRHAYLAGYLGNLRHLVERSFLPAKSLDVETVNGVGAMESPYADDLMEAGFEKGLKTFSMRRRFG